MICKERTLFSYKRNNVNLSLEEQTRVDIKILLFDLRKAKMFYIFPTVLIRYNAKLIGSGISFIWLRWELVIYSDNNISLKINSKGETK